jgi:hypothetical protein
MPLKKEFSSTICSHFQALLLPLFSVLCAAQDVDATSQWDKFPRQKKFVDDDVVILREIVSSRAAIAPAAAPAAAAAATPAAEKEERKRLGITALKQQHRLM